MDKHYDRALLGRLKPLVEGAEWESLARWIGTLSNARFRTVGYLLGEEMMPRLDEPHAWAMATELVRRDNKAFLVTMLKAVAKRMREGTMHLRTAGGRTFLAHVAHNTIDVRKTLEVLLPLMERPEDIAWAMRKLEVEDGEPRLAHLLRPATLPCGFALLGALRYAEHNRPLLVRTTLFLMKRGDGLAFNLASLLRTVYGLDEVKGTFSLHLEPYKLARIETSYEAFCEAMRH